MGPTKEVLISGHLRKGLLHFFGDRLELLLFGHDLVLQSVHLLSLRLRLYRDIEVVSLATSS